MTEGTCPYCATPVRAGAIRCRSCRAWFERRCELCGRPVKGEEARLGRCSSHPVSVSDGPKVLWQVRYELDGRGGGTLLVYTPPNETGGPGLTRGRGFRALSELPGWLERAIREDMAETGARSGTIEIDADLDWRGTDASERWEEGDAGSGAG